MILASHVIMTAYGFWLPNDPRGSWSDFVRQWELLRFGAPTKTTERRSLASAPHDRERRLAARRALRYQPVTFTGVQALCVARGFARAVQESGYVLYGCSILPSHVHLVVARHQRWAQRIAGHLKARATQELVARGVHPFARFRGADGRFPSVWTHRSWTVFLDSPADIKRAVRYVENNPIKERKRAQAWSFVTPYSRCF